MSAALIRQALEFVDPDESVNKNNNRKKRGGRSKAHSSSGQVSKPVKASKKISKQKSQDKAASEQVVKKLLQLSKPSVDTDIADKIIERACSGRPLLNKIKLDTTDQTQSILFPDDNFEQFEQELFCS